MSKLPGQGQPPFLWPPVAVCAWMCLDSLHLNQGILLASPMGTVPMNLLYDLGQITSLWASCFPSLVKWL